jgi:4-oxalocrotonate tautomerase
LQKYYKIYESKNQLFFLFIFASPHNRTDAILPKCHFNFERRFCIMPYVNIKITKEGNVTPEQKRQLIEGATKLLADVLHKNTKTLVVTIDEVDMDNWGIGGVPVTELRKIAKEKAAAEAKAAAAAAKEEAKAKKKAEKEMAKAAKAEEKAKKEAEKAAAKAETKAKKAEAKASEAAAKEEVKAKKETAKTAKKEKKAKKK